MYSYTVVVVSCSFAPGRQAAGTVMLSSSSVASARQSHFVRTYVLWTHKLTYFRGLYQAARFFSDRSRVDFLRRFCTQTLRTTQIYQHLHHEDVHFVSSFISSCHIFQHTLGDHGRSTDRRANCGIQRGILPL